MKITVKPDASGQYYVEHLGVRYNITKDLKDGKCTVVKHGYTLECVAEVPKEPKKKK